MRKSLAVAFVALVVAGCGQDQYKPTGKNATVEPYDEPTAEDKAEQRMADEKVEADESSWALQRSGSESSTGSSNLEYAAKRAAAYVPQIKVGMTQAEVQNQINDAVPPMFTVSSTNAAGVQ